MAVLRVVHYRSAVRKTSSKPRLTPTPPALAISYWARTATPRFHGLAGGKNTNNGSARSVCRSRQPVPLAPRVQSQYILPWLPERYAAWKRNAYHPITRITSSSSAPRPSLPHIPNLGQPDIAHQRHFRARHRKGNHLRLRTPVQSASAMRSSPPSCDLGFLESV